MSNRLGLTFAVSVSTRPKQSTDSQGCIAKKTIKLRELLRGWLKLLSQWKSFAIHYI